MPKSYLPDEPGAMRALHHNFEPYEQVTARLEALHAVGHPTDKIELLILGGTWSAYKRDYREWFLRRCLDALNEADSATLEEPDVSVAAQRRKSRRRRIGRLTSLAFLTLLYFSTTAARMAASFSASISLNGGLSASQCGTTSKSFPSLSKSTSTISTNLRLSRKTLNLSHLNFQWLEGVSFKNSDNLPIRCVRAFFRDKRFKVGISER